MPIELTRRDVVKAGLAATVAGMNGCAPASYVVGPNRAARPGTDRVLVLSDTHVAGDPATLGRADVSMAERLEAVLDDAMPIVGRGGHALQIKGPVRSSDYDFALLNGDAAYDVGAVEDYTTLVGLLSRLSDAGTPTHVLLGNHDHRERFWSIASAERQSQPGRAPSSTPVAGKHVRKLGVDDGSRFCDWLLLDSLRSTDEVPGTLGEDQLAWLDAALAEDPGRPAVLVLHHPPVADDDPEEPFGLLDFVAFGSVVQKHAHVKAVLHGHTHRWDPDQYWISFLRRRVPMIGLPPTSYVFEEGRPWGYVVADVDASGATFTLRAMDGHAADGEAARVEF
ncbi:MAG: metallophosphoesterase [Planctomycetota bacterium]